MSMFAFVESCHHSVGVPSSLFRLAGPGSWSALSPFFHAQNGEGQFFRGIVSGLLELTKAGPRAATPKVDGFGENYFPGGRN